MNDEQFLLFRNHRLFQKLSREDLKNLHVDVNFRVFKKNELVYFPNEWSNRLFFLKKGYIKIAESDTEGNEKIKEVITQGDIFGQFTLEPDNTHNEYAQVIRADACLCTFTIDGFQELLEKRPDLSLSYLKWAGLKIKRLENRYTDILHRDVTARLMSFLLQLAESHSPQPLTDQPVMFPMVLTHEEMARLIGTTRQTVTQKLAQLEREGVITYNSRILTLSNPMKIAGLLANMQ